MSQWKDIKREDIDIDGEDIDVFIGSEDLETWLVSNKEVLLDKIKG